MPFKAFFLYLALVAVCGSALEVSRREWTNPSRAGNVIWLKNPHKWPRTVDSLWVRDIGFQTWSEARLKAGRQVRAYSAAPARGTWILLKPKDRRKIRVRARDSLMVSAFEIGDRLMAGRDARAPEEDFSLELRIVDNAGRACSVKISETRPAYIIETRNSDESAAPGEE